MSSAPELPLNLKARGDLAELMVATDLLRRGHTRSDGTVVNVRCRSHSLTNGKIRRTKQYTAATIGILAVYDVTSDRCYYVPATELGAGRSILHLRLTPAKNGQKQRTRAAVNYLDP